MHARAIQRWLWGLLVLGLLVVPGRGLSRGLAKTPPSAPPAAPSVAPEVLVAPFTAPAAMPALGAELARALHAALREANIRARLGKGDESGALSGRLEEISQAQVRLFASYHGHTAQSVGDLEHLDDLVYAVFSQLRPRLQATAEPADNRLAPAGPRDALATAGSPSPGSPSAPGSPTALSAGGAAAGAPATAAASAATAAKDLPPASAAASDRGAASKDPGRAGSGHRAAEAQPLASGKKSAPIITASASSGTASAAGKNGGKDGNKDGNKDDGRGGKDGKDGSKGVGKDGNKDDGKASADTVATSTPARPPEGPGTVPGSPTETPPASSYPSLPKTPPPPLPRPPVTPTSPYPAYADPRRPRVAVHVVGEPLARVPPGFYGLGAVGQQTLMSYLQQRWHVPAAGSRLVGLTGGLAALDHSLRLGARHTLMARLDSLVLSASPTAGSGPGGNAGIAGIGGTLSGRLHVVLLLDGKLLLDRSITMPPTLVLSSETPAQAYSRILFAALDQVAGELYARLVQPPPG